MVAAHMHTKSVILTKLFGKKDENMPASSSSRPPNPLHNIPFINVQCWSIFLRNRRELVCGGAHYGATFVGSCHYHYQISSYALTPGPVVISRLDDHTLLRPTLHLTHMHTQPHTHPPGLCPCMYTHGDAGKHKYPFTPSC